MIVWDTGMGQPADRFEIRSCWLDQGAAVLGRSRPLEQPMSEDAP